MERVFGVTVSADRSDTFEERVLAMTGVATRERGDDGFGPDEGGCCVSPGTRPCSGSDRE